MTGRGFFYNLMHIISFFSPAELFLLFLMDQVKYISDILKKMRVQGERTIGKLDYFRSFFPS